MTTEPARAAIETAFQRPAVATIYATVKPADLASIHVLEKRGMCFDCFLPENDRLLYRRDRPATN